jgi:hypothetical protein
LSLLKNSRRFTSPLPVETVANRRANSNSNSNGAPGQHRPQLTARHEAVHNPIHGHSTVHSKMYCVNTYRRLQTSTADVDRRLGITERKPCAPSASSGWILNTPCAGLELTFLILSSKSVVTSVTGVSDAQAGRRTAKMIVIAAWFAHHTEPKNHCSQGSIR